jgi:hypothetical protein
MDPAKKKALLATVKNFVIEQLKGAAVKAALKAFLGTAAGVGFKAWLIKFVVTELYEEIGEPLIKAAFVQMGYYYDRTKGKITIKRIQEARESNNGQAYNTAVDDIFIE